MNREDFGRMVIAIALMFGVIFAWQYFFVPKTPPVPPAAVAPATAPAQPGAPAAAPAQAPAPVTASPAPAAAPTGPAITGDLNASPTTVRTAKQEIVVSPRGGRLMSWKLLGYRRVPSKPDLGIVDLVSTESWALDREPMTLMTGDTTLDATVNAAPCRVEEREATPEEIKVRALPAGTRHVSVRWADGQGLAMSKDLYIAGDDSYLARVEWSLTRGGQPVNGASLWWGPSIGRPAEGGPDNQYAYRGRVGYPENGKLREVYPEKQTTDISWPAGAVPRWLALNDQYFSVTLIPEQATGAAIRATKVPADSATAQPTSALGLSVAANTVTIFAGPKSTTLFKTLDQRLGTNLTLMVPWGFFWFFAQPLYVALAWLTGLVHNWGVAIVLITIVIRLAFFPITQKSMVKMRITQQKMAKLQPKIHKLKEKYKGVRDMESKRKMNEEMMELYKREGVNPMASLSGCLPLLLQLPVLYAMFTVLTVATELRGAPFFGWIQDLSAKDPYYITPIVMGLTMLLQQWMSMTKTEDPQQRSQQRMMLMMPLIMTWIFKSMPSGLVIYWLVSNVLSIVQQALINRHAARVPATA